MAHSTPNAIDISPTFQAEPWRISVQPMAGGWDPQSHIQPIEIQDQGLKCGLLTIVGGRIMSPGDKILLNLQLLHLAEASAVTNNNDNAKVLTCHQVCACIKGEEYAIGADGSKTRSRSYVFDTDHVLVNPKFMEQVSLELILPLGAPFTIYTDLVEIVVSCRVDVTVQVPQDGGRGDGGEESYKVLTIDFPIRVVSSMPMEERGDDVLSDELEKNIMHVMEMGERARGVSTSCREVITPDVLNDLNMLSLHALNNAP